MSDLFPNPTLAPPDAAARALEEVERFGPWGGPTLSYRGARIECLPGAHVCGLMLDGHPFNGLSFGSPGTITPLVDTWLDQRGLPSYMRPPTG